MSSLVGVSTDSSFAADIATGITLVDFWAEWCGPCRAMIPKLDELVTLVGKKAKVMKMNVDENPGTPQSFRIMSIPTMILFKDGKPVEKFVGIQMPADLAAAIEKHSK